MDGVARRLLVDERAGRHLEVGLDQVEEDAALAAERDLVDERGLDVLEATDRVEIVGLVVVERRLVRSRLNTG